MSWVQILPEQLCFLFGEKRGGESIRKHLKIRTVGYNSPFRNVYYSNNGIKSSRNSVKEQDIRFKFASTIDAAKILRNPLKKEKKFVHIVGFRVAGHI